MKNKTPQLLMIFMFSLFIIPQITFAAWWNPVSWFEKEKTIQLNATSTKNSALESATVFKSNNIPNNTDVSPGKTENKSSEFVNTVLNESNIENVAELKATILRLQKEITLLQNKEQAKKTPTEPVEKIIYRDRIIEKPTEKILYRDNITEKPTEKIIYQEKIVEKPVEKIVYRDRVIEKPVEKIVYQDRVVQGTCSANNTSSVISESSSSSSEYSDYNFDYEWGYYKPDPAYYAPSNAPSNAWMSCPSTFRNIVVKKAVFKIPADNIDKIQEMESKKDSSHQYDFSAKLSAAGEKVVLERINTNTFAFFNGGIPVCGNGHSLSLNTSVALFPINLPNEQPLYFYPSLVPEMSEWEMWDYTTNKPVKIK